MQISIWQTNAPPQPGTDSLLVSQVQLIEKITNQTPWREGEKKQRLQQIANSHK